MGVIAHTKQVQIVLNTPIGPLTAARRQKVGEFLGPTFAAQRTPLPNAAVFVNAAERRTIFVAEGQLNYTQDGQDITLDTGNVLYLLGGLRDTLLLDNRFNAMVQLVSHVEAEVTSTEQSVHFLAPLPEEEMRERFEGLRGIGLRINFEQPPYVVDLLVEPFFRDPTRYFLKLTATAQQPVTIERLAEDASNYGDYLTEDAVDFLEDCLQE
jgi:hypothetical protein